MDVGKPQTNTPLVRNISPEPGGIPNFDAASLGDAVPLAERKLPKSPKRAPEVPDDDFENDSDDSDSSVVEETAQEVLDEADAILKDPRTASVIEAVTGVETDPNDPDAKELIDAVIESGVTDVEVKAVGPGKKTKISAENGKKKFIKLSKNEKSREVKVGGETVLVLNETLSEQEVREETTQFVVGQIDSVAVEYGLDTKFDPFFNFLENEGFVALVPYYGNYSLPKVQRWNTNFLFKRDEQEDRDRDRRIFGKSIT